MIDRTYYVPDRRFHRFLRRVTGLPSEAMTQELVVQRVEVRFVGSAPTRQVERASGVQDVEVDGRVLRCTVHGSFQPFLEALRGHEVISLKSTNSGE
jgi:hypothetical protein